jgi:hypothetical protein
MFGLKQQVPHADLGYREGALRADGCSSHARPELSVERFPRRGQPDRLVIRIS